MLRCSWLICAMYQRRCYRRCVLGVVFWCTHCACCMGMFGAPTHLLPCVAVCSMRAQPWVCTRLFLVRMVHFNSECLASCGTCTTDCPVHCVCAALACACMLPLRQLVCPTFRPPVFHPVRWCTRVIHCACFWLASRILGAAFGAHCTTVRPLWSGPWFLALRCPLCVLCVIGWVTHRARFALRQAYVHLL